MFNSPLCDRTLNQFPLFFSWGPLKWINQGLPIVFLSAICLGIFWLIRRPQKRRRLFRSPLFYAILSVFLTFILLVISVANALFLPNDPGIAVDAIVILGRGQPLRTQRVQAATQLWQSGRSPLIFVSGIGDTEPTLEQLRENQIPDSALDGETCSLTTRENAQFTAAILNPQNYPSILLITDPPHLWRSLFEFRAQGYTVIPHPSPLPSQWRIEQKTFLAIREVIFLVTSSFQLFLFPDSALTPANPPTQALLQQAQQYGIENR